MVFPIFRQSRNELDEAAQRIMRIIDEKDSSRRRLAAKVGELKAAGWRPPRPARPGPRGESLHDAARAIEALLDDEEAYRAEAMRQLAQVPTIQEDELAIDGAAADAATPGFTDDDILRLFSFHTTGPWESFESEVYNDPNLGVPTIGYGYALVVRGPDGWTVRPQDQLESVGIPLSDTDRTKLQEVADILNDPNIRAADKRTEIEAATEGHQYGVSLTEDDAERLFGAVLPEYKGYVLRAIESPPDDEVGEEALPRFPRLFPEQQAALIDFAYQYPDWLTQNATDLRDALDDDYANADANWTRTQEILGRMGRNTPRRRSMIDLFIDPKADDRYQARPGDTLSSIGRATGLPQAEIVRQNPLIAERGWNRLQAGERVVVKPLWKWRGTGQVP